LGHAFTGNLLEFSLLRVNLEALLPGKCNIGS